MCGCGCGCGSGFDDDNEDAAREVAMTPCEYCRTLFPRTVTTCPNCGAKRKFMENEKH